MTSPPPLRPAIRSSRLRPILAFLGLTFSLTAVAHWYIIFEAKTIHTYAVVALMWIPGLAAILCSKYFNLHFRDLALNRPGRRALFYSYAVPALNAVILFALLLILGIGQFKMVSGAEVARALLVAPTLGVIASFILALGEELGWRGYLHTHLLRAGAPHPILITGGIWAAWHWPLILFTDYATSEAPLVSVALFTVMTVSFGVVLGWLREYSKSVVPAVLAHAAHNVWIQSVYPSFYLPGRLDPYFGGESGFLLAIIYLLIAIYLYQRYPLALRR